MASEITIKWHIERAEDTLRTLNERLPVTNAAYEPGSRTWYAALTGRMSVQLEALMHLLSDTLD